jgi:uncharacterized protein (DUF2147 family)
MRKYLLSLVFILLVPLSTKATGKDDILGKWFSEDKSIKIEFSIYEDKYYANIVWMSEPKDKEGNEKLDKNNPDPQKRNKPILGLTIVWGLSYDNEKWTNGYVYSPQKGVIVNCDIHIDKDGRLALVASKFGIKREKFWTRE